MTNLINIARYSNLIASIDQDRNGIRKVRDNMCYLSRSYQSTTHFSDNIIESINSIGTNLNINDYLIALKDSYDNLIFTKLKIKYIPTCSLSSNCDCYFKNLISKPISFFISLHNGWFNVRFFKNNRWVYLKNSQDYIIWNYSSSKYPWEEVISFYADYIDTDINTILCQSNIFIDDFIKYSSGALYNKFIDNIKIHKRDYNLYPLDYRCFDGFDKSQTIFYLDWNGLMIVTWGRNKILKRLISNLSLGKNIHNIFKSKLRQGSYFDTLCQRMLIEENDDLANTIGSNDHINPITIEELKKSLQNYFNLIIPLLPEYDKVRFEGWFNSRLFKSIIKDYNFLDYLNLGQDNILDPWNKVFLQDKIDG